MAILTINLGLQTSQLTFAPPAKLSDLLMLADASVGQPCGGRGVCGKCAVLLTGNISDATPSEARLNCRLACQATILGDASVTLPALHTHHIQAGAQHQLTPHSPMPGKYGTTIDIGTTTLVLQLRDLATGALLGCASMLNPQTSVSADVIGRIDAACKGRLRELQNQVASAIHALLTTVCAQAEISPDAIASFVITGNTTMLYLLNGRSPVCLGRAPFHADCLFGNEHATEKKTIYFPPCLQAFVGADTTCAILASGMLERTETALLCDVGTNGELALWHKGQLYIASTAAGPAFEGAGISCGCGSIDGAIDRVDLLNGITYCHTLGNQPAVGICGSGLLDAIAVMLDSGVLDESGAMDEPVFLLREQIMLTQADIRAVQLAKAATYAGIQTMLDAANCTEDDVSTLYLAGGFGSHLNLRSAARIGLLPATLAMKAKVIGNAALDGAAQLLLNTSRRADLTALQGKCMHVRLDGNPAFAERYIDAMLFPEEGDM